VNDPVSLEDVEEIYLPLSRLLSLHVAAVQELHATTGTFLDRRTDKVPYVIGIAGSVAVGKSTFARLLQTLLKRWPSHPQVDLVTTDGFLYPNAVPQGPRPDGTEGLPGELRPAAAGAVPGRREIGQGRGAGPGLLPSHLRHRAGQVHLR
jgi:type I pantothenate kinase